MIKKVMFLLVGLAAVSLAIAADLSVGHSAYVIHDGQPLLTDKDPDSTPVAKLNSHQEYPVVAISGKWVQLQAGSVTGWVYSGNLSREEPPKINTSSFSTEASSTTLNAAARGLDNDAIDYANRQGESESAQDIAWMEQQNDAVHSEDVKAYLKDHKLGEYQ